MCKRTHLTVSDKMTWIVKNVSSGIISSLIARSSVSFIYSMEWKTDACCYKHTYLSCKWKGNLIKYDVIVNIYNYKLKISMIYYFRSLHFSFMKILNYLGEIIFKQFEIRSIYMYTFLVYNALLFTTRFLRHLR